MYCNVLASTRCHVFASSLHGKASLLHCKRRLQCSKTDVQNHIGNQLQLIIAGVLGMAWCAVWSLLLEFHMKFLQIYFCPAAESSGLTTAYLGVNGEQNCILKTTEEKCELTVPDQAVYFITANVNITGIGQEGGPSWSASTARVFTKAS